MRHDAREKPDALLVVGTSLTIPGIQNLIKLISRTVRAQRGGLSVWVNIAPEPSALRSLWDVVLGETADGFALGMYEKVD